MRERTFAPWVEPTAAQLRESRWQVAEFARSLPPEAWSWPSPDEGWTYKDILAHLGRGNDQMLQTILRAVVARDPLDASILAIDTDAENARRVEERRERSVEELIAELEEAGEEIQDLLSRLSEEDEELRQEDMPMSLGEFLRMVHTENHDLEHLSQLRSAVRESAGAG